MEDDKKKTVLGDTEVGKEPGSEKSQDAADGKRTVAAEADDAEESEDEMQYTTDGTCSSEIVASSSSSSSDTDSEATEDAKPEETETGGAQTGPRTEDTQVLGACPEKNSSWQGPRREQYRL